MDVNIIGFFRRVQTYFQRTDNTESITPLYILPLNGIAPDSISPALSSEIMPRSKIMKHVPQMKFYEPKKSSDMDNPTKKSYDLLIIYTLFLAPALFVLIWIMLGKPAYTWDALWYRDIVDNGYSFNGDITKQQNVAFLPGYPIIIKIIAIIFGFNSVIAQQVVSLLGYIVGSCFFFNFLSLRIGEYKSAAVVMIWSLMPFSIYFINGYSESVLFALVGAFFYFLERRKFTTASIIISYGLITRPQAIAMLPVLFYILHQNEHKKGGLSWCKSLVCAGVRSIETAPIIMLFPVIYTLYCYFCFGDSLIYKNILFAWGTGSDQSLGHNLSLVANSILAALSGLQYSPYLIYKINYITFSPHQLFSCIIILGSLMTPVFLTIKYYDLFIYNLSVIIFWLLASNISNGGRHISLVFSIPFAVVIGLGILQRNSNKYKANKLVYTLTIFLGFLSLAMFITFVIHFIWYTIRYFNGIWVS